MAMYSPEQTMGPNSSFLYIAAELRCRSGVRFYNVFGGLFAKLEKRLFNGVLILNRVGNLNGCSVWNGCWCWRRAKCCADFFWCLALVEHAQRSLIRVFIHLALLVVDFVLNPIVPIFLPRFPFPPRRRGGTITFPLFHL